MSPWHTVALMVRVHSIYRPCWIQTLAYHPQFLTVMSLWRKQGWYSISGLAYWHHQPIRGLQHWMKLHKLTSSLLYQVTCDGRKAKCQLYDDHIHNNTKTTNRYSVYILTEELLSVLRLAGVANLSTSLRKTGKWNNDCNIRSWHRMWVQTVHTYRQQYRYMHYSVTSKPQATVYHRQSTVLHCISVKFHNANDRPFTTQAI